MPRPAPEDVTIDAVDRERLLRDVEMSRRVQVFCAWCGPAFVICLFGGWGVLGGFIPLVPPGDDAREVARLYLENADERRAGTVIGLVGIFLTIPFFFAISMQIRRSEVRTPVLAILQFASGIIVTVVLIIPMLLFAGAAFRPERAPELTRLINDVSYIMLILPWPPIIGQLMALVVSVFADRSPRPAFPRWVGYYNLWVAVLLIPATLILFFASGPFSWNGVLGFWIPAAVFGVWYLVMTALLLRAIKEEAEIDAERLGRPGVVDAGAAAR